MTITATLPQNVPTSDLDPFSDEFLDDPYDAHRDLRDAGPVVYLKRYGAWAVSRYEEVTQVLSDPATFCSSAGVGLSDFTKEEPWRPPSLLLEADPPEHSAARRVVTSVFSPIVVRKLREEFLEKARRMVGELVKKGSFDAVTDLATAFPLAVFPDFVGIAKEGRENLIPYGSMVFNTFGPRNKHFEKAVAKAESVTAWIMEQCRVGAVTQGLGVEIHAAAKAAGYSDEDSAKLLRSFLTAGVDTTVHGIGNAILCLAENPEQFEALRADPSLARAAFEEVVRFEAPVQTFFCTTTRDVDVSGIVIPAGEKVLMFLAAANRDERKWENPDQYDIRRKAAGHVGFGYGVHACLGQMLARLEGEVVLTALAEQVSSITITGPYERQLNNTLRGLESLPVTVTGN